LILATHLRTEEAIANAINDIIDESVAENNERPRTRSEQNGSWVSTNPAPIGLI